MRQSVYRGGIMFWEHFGDKNEVLLDSALERLHKYPE
jgi:GH18 family chitinase